MHTEKGKNAVLRAGFDERSKDRDSLLQAPEKLCFLPEMRAVNFVLQSNRTPLNPFLLLGKGYAGELP